MDIKTDIRDLAKETGLVTGARIVFIDGLQATEWAQATGKCIFKASDCNIWYSQDVFSNKDWLKEQKFASSLPNLFTKKISRLRGTGIS